MNATLRRAAGLVERRPGLALTALLLLTLLFGGLAGQQTTDTDMGAFAPESELAATNDRIVDEFGGDGGAAVQVIVDAGDGGDVLSTEGLDVAARIAALAADTPEVAAALADETTSPAVLTYAAPFQAALGPDAEVSDAELDALAAQLLADPEAGAQVGALLSEDLDAQAGTARGGLVVVRLSSELSMEQRADAELAFADALADLDAGSFEVAALGENIVADQLLRDMEEEMPVLLGLAFALILGILLLTYRRVSDVVLGLGGLVVTIVWTFGLSVLLGPNYLGITGEMTQISMMIPVLLIGLAIDYAIHLTSRYREEATAGATPARAAHAAVLSVGGALVLATATTVIGFLTNVFSPLPPMRDFGIFVAAGVVSAFVVMLLLVPAARTLLDTRRGRRGRFVPPASGTGTRLGRLMGRAAVLAERHAVPTLAVAVVLTVVAGIGGSRISTTFSQDDFIPEDSEIGQLLAQVQTLFGGDLDETTYVLVEGDLTDPDVFAAMLTAQAEMADTDDVRAGDLGAQVTSPATMVASLAAEPSLADPLAALGWSDAGPAPDADVAGLYDLAREVAPEATATVLNDDGSAAVLAVATTAGQERAETLRDGLTEDTAALRDAGATTTVVSQLLVFEESLDALTASQTQGILITLLAALIVLVGFFTVRSRRPLLGVVTMVPSVLVSAWVLGSMWLLGISFNVMTAMVASLAIGIGVPYGIHVTNRFSEDLQRTGEVDAAIRETVTHTGSALLGSAATTAAGFGVLAFASLAPMQQFGLVTALTIVYSLIAAVLVEPACLKLWADWRTRRDAGAGDRPEHRDPAPVA
ncbi:MMPL family transporter [Nitriliruptoraceae bacterium ZYF776]|nr:MMPL family transporter [Profundirhabdus halotolerans]